MDAESYLLNVMVKLAVSRAIQSVEIIDERIVLSDRGYFRARLSLVNGDFLELAEYFICENGECFPKIYRYQWMDREQKQLQKTGRIVLSTSQIYPDFPIMYTLTGKTT